MNSLNRQNKSDKFGSNLFYNIHKSKNTWSIYLLSIRNTLFITRSMSRSLSRSLSRFFGTVKRNRRRNDILFNIFPIFSYRTLKHDSIIKRKWTWFSIQHLSHSLSTSLKQRKNLNMTTTSELFFIYLGMVNWI